MDPFLLSEIGSTGLRVTRLGLGGGPVGVLDPDLSDRRAVATIRRALELGIGYVDTAPAYGRFRSEFRYGRALATVPRDSYVISTKVGYPLSDVGYLDPARLTLRNLPDITPVYDCTRDGIMRSFEQSLSRLGLDRVDILLLHSAPQEHHQTAKEQAAPALSELRAQGMVKAIGAGLDNLDLLVWFAREADFDCFLLPWRYNLADQSAISDFLPLCVEKGISIIMAAPYDGGRLFGQGPARPETERRVLRLQEICDRHQVPVRAAALQFVASHPAAVSVIPGPRSAKEVKDNIRMMQHPIPSDLWADLRQEGLISPDSPTPQA